MLAVKFTYTHLDSGWLPIRLATRKMMLLAAKDGSRSCKVYVCQVHSNQRLRKSGQSSNYRMSYVDLSCAAWRRNETDSSCSNSLLLAFSPGMQLVSKKNASKFLVQCHQYAHQRMIRVSIAAGLCLLNAELNPVWAS